MANVANKENMTISIREYTDNQGQTKKVWKTIGELITWDDSSKSFELWGPTGSTKGNVFARDDQSNQQPQQGQPVQQPQQRGGQGFHQPQNQGFNQQPQGGFNNNGGNNPPF